MHMSLEWYCNPPDEMVKNGSNPPLGVVWTRKPVITFNTGLGICPRVGLRERRNKN
jgi:hypothetical protein